MCAQCWPNSNVAFRVMFLFSSLFKKCAPCTLQVALQSYTFESVMYHILHQRLPLHSFRHLTYWWEHRTHLYRSVRFPSLLVLWYRHLRASAFLQSIVRSLVHQGTLRSLVAHFLGLDNLKAASQAAVTAERNLGMVSPLSDHCLTLLLSSSSHFVRSFGQFQHLKFASRFIANLST